MLTGVIAVLAIVLVAGGSWAVGRMLSSDDSSDTTASSERSRPATSSTSAATSDAPSETASPTPTEDPAAEARSACVAQVKASDRIAAAAKNSAAHWKTHTDAYLQKVAGKATFEQTQKVYAASKAFGLADEKEFAAATKQYQATGKACADAVAVAPDDPTITACSTRLAALDKVRVTGTTVQSEWSLHMRAMAGKAHADMGAYHQAWLKAVGGAQKSIPAYAAAAAAVAKAPACA